jgi:hypothetical protein
MDSMPLLGMAGFAEGIAALSCLIVGLILTGVSILVLAGGIFRCLPVAVAIAALCVPLGALGLSGALKPAPETEDSDALHFDSLERSLCWCAVGLALAAVGSVGLTLSLPQRRVACPDGFDAGFDESTAAQPFDRLNSQTAFSQRDAVALRGPAVQPDALEGVPAASRGASVRSPGRWALLLSSGGLAAVGGGMVIVSLFTSVPCLLLPLFLAGMTFVVLATGERENQPLVGE